MFPKENRYFETENGILYNCDCLSLIKQFPKECIDLIITDPPYAISYKTNRRKNKEHEFCSEIANDNNPEVLQEAIPFFYDLLKQDKAIYIFGSWKTVDIFKPLVSQYFNLKNIIIWYKNSWTTGDLKAQFGQQYEIIYYGNKGRAIFNGKRFPDVWQFDRVVGKKQIHQNQKPIEMIEKMLNIHSKESELVLDIFAGSGTTLVASENLNRRWIGVELEAKYCEIAKQRLLNLKGDGNE